MKEIKITPPEGYEVDKENSTFEKIVFKPIVDLSIINDTDWFYIETSWSHWLAKGNILSSYGRNSIHHNIKTGTVYRDKYPLTSGRINSIRKATKEEIEAFYNKFPQYKEKPKWEDFGKINGCFTTSLSQIVNMSESSTHGGNKNTWPTKEEADAALALSQLCQWRDKYNEGWKPNWDNNDAKNVIYVASNELTKDSARNYQHVLAFKSREIRDKFFNDFEELIEVAKPLL